MQTALELFELGEAMLRQRLRRENPLLTEDEVERAVRAWYASKPGPELGAATGRTRKIQ